jgi:hypothetical protein
MQGDVMAANAYFGKLGYVIHPTLAADAKARTIDSGSGRFVMENNTIDGFRTLVSAQSTYSSENKVFFGNFDDLMIGYWSPGIDVSVHKEFDDGRVRLIVFVDADIAVRHAGSFSMTVNA